MDMPIYKTRPMLQMERRVGKPLETYLADEYRTKTLQQIADENGVTVGTVSRWFRELRIETRFPGQRPEVAA